MKGKAGAASGKAKAHQPAPAGAAAAQAAAVPPGNDLQSQAAGAQVEEMGAQQPGTFDRKAFIAAVQKAIDAAAPKNLEEADDFKGSGKAAQVKGEVGSLVKGGKKDAEKDIKTATDAPPDTSKATPKQVAPLQPEEPGSASSSVGAAGAMPGPRPAEDTDLSAGPAEVEQEMDREGVTEEQLAKSNEPDFSRRARRPPGGQGALREGARGLPRAGGRDPRAGPRRGQAGRGDRARRHARLQGRRARQGRGGQGGGQEPGRGQAHPGRRRHPGDLRQDQDRGLRDPHRPRRQGRLRLLQRRGAGAQAVRGLRGREDGRLQGRPLQRPLRRRPLAQGQVVRDAGRGQRVLQPGPRRLPDRDGHGDRAGRRHRRRRAQPRARPDRPGPRRRPHLRLQAPGRPPAGRQGRRGQARRRSSTSSRARSTASRTRSSTRSRRSTSPAATRSTPASRR